MVNPLPAHDLKLPLPGSAILLLGARQGFETLRTRFQLREAPARACGREAALSSYRSTWRRFCPHVDSSPSLKNVVIPNAGKFLFSGFFKVPTMRKNERPIRWH